MINIASKAGHYLRATNQVVASGIRPLAGAALAEKKKVTTDKSSDVQSLWSLQQALPVNNVQVKSGVCSEYCDKAAFCRASLFIYVFSMVLLKII